MSTHLSDDLPQLLTGEATREVVQAAAEHLRTCDDCQQELVSAVVAHASLTSAHRFAPEIIALSGEPSDSDDDPLPDLSSIFAQVREEASAETATRSRRPLRRPLLAVAAVAAAALVAGGGLLLTSSGGHTSSGTSIALAAFDEGTTSAKATITSSGHMDVDAASLPTLSSAQRYEVWLTNDDRTDMKPIGWLGDNGDAELTVPTALMKSYSDIEVSVQQVDDPTYTYSGISVLRGSYSEA